MHRRGKRDAVLNDIRSIFSNCPNMSRMHLGVAISIDYSKTSYSASMIVGVVNDATEIGVSHNTVGQHGCHSAITLSGRRRLDRLTNITYCGGGETQARRIADVQRFAKSVKH